MFLASIFSSSWDRPGRNVNNDNAIVDMGRKLWLGYIIPVTEQCVLKPNIFSASVSVL